MNIEQENVLLKKNELNENYHNSKERSGWISFSVYLSFSLVFFEFIFKKTFSDQIYLLISFIYFLLSLLAVIFISKQFMYKAISVVKTICFERMLKYDHKDYTKGIRWLKAKNINRPSLFNMEVPLYLLFSIIYFGNQIFLFSKYSEKTDLIMLYFLFYSLIQLIIMITCCFFFIMFDTKSIINDFIENNIEEIEN